MKLKGKTRCVQIQQNYISISHLNAPDFYLLAVSEWILSMDLPHLVPRSFQISFFIHIITGFHKPAL